MRVSQHVRRSEIRRAPQRPHLPTGGKLGTYPFTHNYIRPNDFLLPTTLARRNFVFDADLVSSSVRFFYSYNNGPILERWTRKDGSFLLTEPELACLHANQIAGNEYTGTWAGQFDPWTVSNQRAVPTAFNHTPGTTNTSAFVYHQVWTGNVGQGVAPTNSDFSVVVKAASGRAGLAMRSNGGTSNVYYIDIAAAVVKVGVNVGGTGQGTTVFTGTTPIVANTDYTLRLVNVGNSYTAYINGVSEGTFSTAVNNGPWVGIWADDLTASFGTFSAVKIANPSATNWSVRNYDGDVVASGSVTDDHIDIPDSSLTWRGHGPYGWYRLYLTGPDRGDGQWGTAYGDSTFYRIRTETGMYANAPNKFTGQNEGQMDEYAKAAMGGLGLQRFPCSSVTTGTVAANNADVAISAPFFKTNWVDLAPSSRPRINLGAFPAGTLGIDSTITATVNLLKTSIQGWEPRNEPDYGTSGEFYITNEFDPFRNAVKAADATAKMVGPGPVSYNQTLLPFINSFLVGVMTRGGTSYLDGFSVHGYNCTNGDLALARRTLTGFKAAITSNGYTGSLYQTEQGFSWEYFTVLRPRHGTQWTALARFMEELHGIPHDNNSYWYDVSHGFGDVPMWWLDGPGLNGVGPGPQALPCRVMAAEIGNRTLTAQFGFDTFSQYLYAGGTWTGGDGSKTVGFIASSVGLRDLTLNVTGTSSLTCCDCWGNTFTVSVTTGQATLPVTEMPVWVRCPAGVTATPAAIGFSTNLASTATVSSTGDQNLMARVNDGVFQNFYDSPGGLNYTGSDAFYSDRSNTFPQTVTLTWGSPVTANRIVIYSMPPWQELATLTDFDVDTWDGASWTTRYSQSVPASKTFLFTGVSKNLVETFWDDRCVWDIAFTTATFSKVRIVVRACSYGEFETNYVRTQIYGGPSTQYLMLREVEVFNANVATPPTTFIRQTATRAGTW